MDLWTFAYGSNMDLEELCAWLRSRQHATSVRDPMPAMLLDHRLVWNYYSRNRQGGAANVERYPGSVVHGLLLRIDERTLCGIDAKEGHPCFYERRPVSVRSRDGRTFDAVCYYALPSRCSDEPVWPTRSYLQVVVAAARKHGLDESYVAALEQTPTLAGPQTS